MLILLTDTQTNIQTMLPTSLAAVIRLHNIDKLLKVGSSQNKTGKLLTAFSAKVNSLSAKVSRPILICRLKEMENSEQLLQKG